MKFEKIILLGVGVLLVATGVLFLGFGAYGVVTEPEREGAEWSQAALYECELDPDCDEAAAAREARLWRESATGSSAPIFILGVCMAAFGSAVVGIGWGRPV